MLSISAGQSQLVNILSVVTQMGVSRCHSYHQSLIQPSFLQLPSSLSPSALPEMAVSHTAGSPPAPEMGPTKGRGDGGKIQDLRKWQQSQEDGPTLFGISWKTLTLPSILCTLISSILITTGTHDFLLIADS